MLRRSALLPQRLGLGLSLGSATGRKSSLASELIRMSQYHSSAMSSQNKVTSVEDAISLVKSHNTISVSGFVAQGSPETLLRALGDRFRNTGQPSDLKLVFGGGPGDFATKGLNHLAQKGMIRRVVGSHYGQVPMLASMALNNEIEAYCLPLGSISRMLRAAASASPGHISKVGMGTFIDPLQTGGRLNAKSTKNVVERVTILGEEYLCYLAIPINVAIIRATTGDTAGNLSFERESLYTDARVIAMAARSSGGVVIAQVERLAEPSTLPMRSVHIPGALVDCVVLAERPEDSNQSYFTEYNPAWSGEIREPTSTATNKAANVLNARKIIARRAALELRPDQIVNLGIGMPEGVAAVAKEENFVRFSTLTTEGGVFGGVGASGHDFGPASGADAVVEMNQQFDFYDGGGLDICFLGLAQCGANGDVNVSRLSESSLTGPGGFINITQCTHRVVFMGTFRKKEFRMELRKAHAEASAADAGAAEESWNELAITNEGKIPTFQKTVKEITFSAQTALQRGQQVLYITERAVFKLTSAGMELIEIAPGLDIDRDILQQMDFAPIVKDRAAVALMDPRIFCEKKMGLVEDLFSPEKALAHGMEFNEDTNTLYLDFTGMVINDQETFDCLSQELEKAYKKRSHNGTKKFHCVVNYDGLALADALVHDWEVFVEHVQSKYYKSITRYAGRSFVRHKLAVKIDVKDADEMWLSFVQGDTTCKELDRPRLREALLTLHHLKAPNEKLLNSLMDGKDVITRKKFPELLDRIRDYVMQGQL